MAPARWRQDARKGGLSASVRGHALPRDRGGPASSRGRPPPPLEGGGRLPPPPPQEGKRRVFLPLPQNRYRAVAAELEVQPPEPLSIAGHDDISERARAGPILHGPAASFRSSGCRISFSKTSTRCSVSR